jgi:hypothetical protein
MARLKHWARVYDWQWQLVIPQFCVPAWGWAMQALQVNGDVASGPVRTPTGRPRRCR